MGTVRGMSERNAVVASDDGRQTYMKLVHESVQWRAYIQTLPGTTEQNPLLIEDLFYALYEPSVELNARVSPRWHRNFAVVADLTATSAFAAMRRETVGDPVMAAMAVQHLATELLREDEGETAGAGRRQLGKALRRTFGWRRKRRPSGDGPAEVIVNEGDETSRRTDGERNRREQSGVVPAYRVVEAAAVTARAVTVDRKIRSVWGIEPGVRTVHVIDDVWNLVKQVRSLPGFEQLTDVIVRLEPFMYPASVGRRRRPRGGRAGYRRLEGLTRGRNLELVAPEEFVRLLDDDLVDLFHDAYEHGRLLQERYVGRRPQHPGPLVCCLDVSRSMNTVAAQGRERFVWAKGIGLALLDVARRTERPFLGICFSSEYDVARFEIPLGGYRPDIAVDFARCDFDGGTHFRTPLLEAIRYLRGDNAPRRLPGGAGGQIIFVTDGQAALPETFVRKFERARRSIGFKLFTVFIDGEQRELIRLSDNVFRVHANRIESWERTSARLAKAMAVSR